MSVCPEPVRSATAMLVGFTPTAAYCTPVLNVPGEPCVFRMTFAYPGFAVPPWSAVVATSRSGTWSPSTSAIATEFGTGIVPRKEEPVSLQLLSAASVPKIAVAVRTLCGRTFL